MAEVKTVRAGEDVVAANAAGAAAMASAATKYPDAPAPVSDLVNLPGGLRVGQTTVTTAQVRELNGNAEEALARAGLPDPRTGVVNAFHYLNTLLEQGTAKIGDADSEESRNLLKRLLVGDRDALLLGIRIFTYGKDLDIPQWECPACGDLSDLTIDLYTDVTTKKLVNPDEAVFEVKLNKGAVASVRLPNGEDQQAMSDNPKATQAERNTVTIQRCVSTIIDATGLTHSMAGFPSLARDMSIPDRRKILKEIAERQPGPQFQTVKLTHAACGNEVSLSLGIGDLFLA
jgi:hypothetical protein